jgi:hypothetical protein
LKIRPLVQDSLLLKIVSESRLTIQSLIFAVLTSK